MSRYFTGRLGDPDAVADLDTVDANDVDAEPTDDVGPIAVYFTSGFVESPSLRRLNPRRLTTYFTGVLGDPNAVADLDTVDAIAR
jgi:hypothetical protein